LLGQFSQNNEDIFGLYLLHMQHAEGVTGCPYFVGVMYLSNKKQIPIL